jgi:uncharacterized membrane protein
MITDGLLMLGVLMALSCVLIVLERRTGWKVFRYVPGMVFMYLACALLNTFGLFGDDDETRGPTSEVADVLLPAMIFLFLFGCDIRRIIKLGPKLLLSYVMAAFSLFLGMVLTYLGFRAFLPEDAWRALSALLASWTGGSANMVAVGDILDTPQDLFGYVLIVDTIMYSVWLMVLFGSVGLAPRFNRFVKADTSHLEIATDDAEEDRTNPASTESLAVSIFGSLAVAVFATWIGGLLPEFGDVVNATTWRIVIVSVLGLIVAVTPLSRTAGAKDIASIMLYLVIGNIATGSDFSSVTDAPLYLLIGVIVLLIHAVLMVIYARLTHTDLFTIAVASAGNMGGPASAPVVAGAYSRQLIPVGVLFALIGSFMGTFVGLGGAQVMSIF